MVVGGLLGVVVTKVVVAVVGHAQGSDCETALCGLVKVKQSGMVTDGLGGWWWRWWLDKVRCCLV